MMKTFTNEELKIIVEKHVKFLNGETGGEKADLSFADLRSANLSSADWWIIWNIRGSK